MASYYARQTKDLATIISVSGVDCNALLQNPQELKDHERCQICPICPAELEIRLWNNGSYPRLFPGEAPGETVLSRIFRKLCRRCRTSFSLHPESLLKRQRYSLAFVAAWLWVFLKRGASVRDRSFLEAHQVALPIEDPLLSWSDSLDQPGQRSRPGYQLLHRWRVLFSSRAQYLLSELVDAAVEVGRLSLSQGWEVVESAQFLQTAWLHWEALWRSRLSTPDIDSDKAFLKFIQFLAKAPSSHKARRAVPRRYPYDVLIR